MPDYFSNLSATLVGKYLTSGETARTESLSTTINDPARESKTHEEGARKKSKTFRIRKTSLGRTSFHSRGVGRRYSEEEESQRGNSNTVDTQEQLAILGYKEELNRRWDFWSLFSLSFCNVGIFPGAIQMLHSTYPTWGPILMTVGALVTACLWVCVNVIFAELSSAFPVAGAMFSWTFNLARANPLLRDWARLLSWVIGFCLSTSHVLLQLEIGKEFSRVFSTLLLASGVKLNMTNKQSLAMGLGYILICGCASLTPIARSPMAWKMIGLVVFILNLVACIVIRATSIQQGNIHTLFAVSPKHVDVHGPGYTMIRAWVITTSVLGSEPAAHMAEETRNPARTLPRVIFYSSVFSGVFQLFCNIFLTLALPPIKHAPSPPGVWNVIYIVFLHCPKAVAQFVTISMLINNLASNVAQFLGTSRFFWALARDKALPFAKYWRQVNSKRQPVRATILMISLCLAFAVLSLEPSNSFMTFASGSIIFLVFFSYMTPVLIYLISDKDVLNRDGRNVSAGCFSKPFALVSVLFLTLFIAIGSGPSTFPVTRKTFPYGPFVGLGVILISLVFWMIYGRSHFVGPVKSLTTWSVGYEVDLPTKMTRVVARNNQAVTTQQPTAGGMGQTEELRSEANLTSQNIQTFGIPRAYCTYDSEGSLWAETVDES